MGRGNWPAFWTLGISGTWPACGEFDIFEMFGHNDWTGDRMVGMYMHCQSPPGSSTLYEKYFPVGENAGDQFRVYGIEWTPTSVRAYIDHEYYGTIDITNPQYGIAFQQEHYMILNYALGGNAGAVIEDPAKPGTMFPRRMEVDYVKIWEFLD